jgi:hypothetical protein
MKKSTGIIFGIIIGLILLGLVIYLLTPKKEFNKFTFPSTMAVKNYTKIKMADTLTMVILNKIMKRDTMTINIYDMRIDFDNEKYQFQAFVIKNEFKKNECNIYLRNDVDFNMLLTILPHELIHVDQMCSNKLRIIENIGYIWSGDTTRFSDIDYEKRPYEIEAYEKSGNIKKELSKILYK